MNLPTITSFLPNSIGELDKCISADAIAAIRYALDQTNCQYIAGELFIADQVGNKHGICGVFTNHIDKYLADRDALRKKYVCNRIHRIFDEMIATWPNCYCNGWDFDKSTTFPIGGSIEYFNERDTNTLWINPKRIELLNYLIEVANNE